MILGGPFGGMNRALAAETGKNPRIAEILVEGNQRIEVEAITTYIDLKIGDEFTQAGVDSSLKSLFRSQLFADAEMSFDQGILSVKVKEKSHRLSTLFRG